MSVFSRYDVLETGSVFIFRHGRPVRRNDAQLLDLVLSNRPVILVFPFCLKTETEPLIILSPGM
jgi:hypothetical protein